MTIASCNSSGAFSGMCFVFCSKNLRSVLFSSITFNGLGLSLVSSLQIPRSTARFNSLLPTVNVSPLKLHSVSSINLYGASNYNIFSNHLRIRLSPIKSPILLKYKNPFKRNSMYPNISKCNAKSCTCCNHLICRSTYYFLS